MIFQQVYLQPLAQASYLIGSDGIAAIVDPRRDIDELLELAASHGLAIEHVLLTHIHADFVSGHVELAARTGATISISHRTDCGFEHRDLREGDAIAFGDLEIRALETPGHTPGDVCYLVRDRIDRATPTRLLSGDTLFLGDVGRPDLAGGLGHSAKEMAAMMYDSLRQKILPLHDDVEVWPAHGAGSACGRNISKEKSSTIGRQRLENWALQEMPRAEFVARLTDGLGDPPRYFQRAADINRRGPRLLGELPPLRHLDAEAIASHAEDGVQLVDGRPPAAYGAGHVHGAINIGLGGSFESWCGQLLDADQGIVLLVDDEDDARQARLRLARVGLEDVVGWSEGAPANGQTASTLEQIDVGSLRQRLAEMQIVDVRSEGEYRGGHVPGAIWVPLPTLPSDGAPLDRLDRSQPTAVVCGSGQRSSTATAWLRARGFERLYNVSGGTQAWRAAGYDVERSE